MIYLLCQAKGGEKDMKAVVLQGPRKLALVDKENPKPKEGEILLKVRAAAICGTDIRMWNTGADSTMNRILGHEVSGIIAATGKDVINFAPGDRVVVAPNMGCGHCRHCISGNSHLCRNYQALGIQLDGAFAEYCIIPRPAVDQGNVFKLSDSIPFAEAAAIEPLSCVFNGFEHYRVQPGDTVLIIGGGPIGAMHALFAKMAGASRVIVNDLSQERLDVLQEVLPGIDTYHGNILRDYVMDVTAGEGVDVCVTACPSPAAQQCSFDLMATNGRVCFFGGLPSGMNMVPLNTNLIHYKQLMVTGTTRSSLSQFHTCLHLVESGVIDLGCLITNHFQLEEHDAAFAHVASAQGLKSVFDIE